MNPALGIKLPGGAAPVIWVASGTGRAGPGIRSHWDGANDAIISRPWRLIALMHVLDGDEWNAFPEPVLMQADKWEYGS